MRKREIAIRKVLASSNNQIVKLIFRKYTKWILISFVIGSPLAYYFTKIWLQEFAFGIVISPWSYLVSLLSMLLIAFLTIGYIAHKSARANPTMVLKHE